MTFRSSLSTLGRVAIVALCAACTLELGLFLAMRSAANVYSVGQGFPRPSGYQLNGQYLQGTPASCYVIRVTADACPYCKQDRRQYTRLAQQAERMGCRVIELAPRAGQMALNASDETVQLQYVDMKLGQALNPFATPQTILLNGKGQMTWQRQGSMDDHDLDLALKTLGFLSSTVVLPASAQTGRQ